MRAPWIPGLPEGIRDWTPDQDEWELYHLDEDWTQADDLAARMPDKLAQMRETFAIEAARNSVYPIGGGLWIPIFHPELRISTPYREWNFTGDITRMPEFCAPALGNRANLVTIDLDVPERANGVLYALGGAGGGLTCYLEDGVLCYEYNLFLVMRTKIRADRMLPAGSAKIEVETVYARPGPAGPLDVTLTVNGSGTPPAECRSARRCCSPPTTASTSAPASAALCPATTPTERRSRSTAPSGTSTSAMSPSSGCSSPTPSRRTGERRG